MTTEQKLRILEIVQEIFEANKKLLELVEELEPSDANSIIKAVEKLFSAQDQLTIKTD